MAGIATSREMAAAKFVCNQSARMMERARSTEKLRGNTHKQKRDAVEVMLTFTAPSLVRKAGDPACVIALVLFVFHKAPLLASTNK